MSDPNAGSATLDFQGRRDELWQAAWRGNHARVLQLLQIDYEGPNSYPNYVNQVSGINNTTPLHAAIFSAGVFQWRMAEEYLLVGQHLLDYGANVLAVSKGGETPLFVSIQQSETASFLEMILKSRPDLNIETRTTAPGSECFDETLLFSAVAHTGLTVAYKNKIDLLLKHGANVNATDLNGNCALHVRSVNDWIFGRLTDCGANVDHQNLRGRTPLHTLAYDYLEHKSRMSPTDVQRYKNKILNFLSHGAHDEIKDTSGKTPEAVVWEGVSTDCHVDARMTDPVDSPDFDAPKLFEHWQAWRDPILVLFRNNRLDKERKLAFASMTHPNSRREGWSNEFGDDTMRMILTDANLYPS